MKKVKPETCKSGGVFPPPGRVECILKAKSFGINSGMKRHKQRMIK